MFYLFQVYGLVIVFVLLPVLALRFAIWLVSHVHRRHPKTIGLG
jgi:hypothetical protein